MTKSVAEEYTSTNKKVRIAQIRLLFRQSWIGLLGSLVVALAACVVFWQIVPQWKLSLWVSFSVLLTLARGGIIFFFQRRAPTATYIDRWATLHVVGVTLSALMWAIPYLFLWPDGDSVYQLVWPIFILPLSAAVVSTYYTWTPSYAPFVLITAGSLSLRFFLEGGFLFNVLGFTALFFIAVLLRAGKVMHAASVRSFEFGIRNETLNEELRETLAIKEQLNEQLQQEIAERKLTEKEREKLITELQEALEEITTLKGVIPICLHCKGIRDDKGYWNKLEQYIVEHSDAEFSHGVCPDCAKKLYPDLYEES